MLAARRVATESGCGFKVECKLSYSLAEVNASALSQGRDDATRVRERRAARQKCLGWANKGINLTHGFGVGEGTGTLETGGWCLDARAAPRTPCRGGSWCTVNLPNQMSYDLPPGHLAADSVVIRLLVGVLSICDDGRECFGRPGWESGCSCSVMRSLSVLDLGAGVGQYGRALLSKSSRHRYRGLDGAGNVEEVTDGFVRFADLTKPLATPRADWVLSTEVGEHIPTPLEPAFVRNLHAHACRGIILSWAVPGKWGIGHTNTHTPSYLAHIFQELGYLLDVNATSYLRWRHGRAHAVVDERRNVSQPWKWLRSAQVFRRITPFRSPECTLE